MVYNQKYIRVALIEAYKQGHVFANSSHSLRPHNNIKDVRARLVASLCCRWHEQISPQEIRWTKNLPQFHFHHDDSMTFIRYYDIPIFPATHTWTSIPGAFHPICGSNFRYSFNLRQAFSAGSAFRKMLRWKVSMRVDELHQGYP